LTVELGGEAEGRAGAELAGNLDLAAHRLRELLTDGEPQAGADHPLQNWFDRSVPETSLPADLIETYLAQPRRREIKGSHLVVWIGGPVACDPVLCALCISTKLETVRIDCPKKEGLWLTEVLASMTPGNLSPFTYQQLQTHYETSGLHDFTLFWNGRTMETLKEFGLLTL
jgi:hypothetical protein